MLPLRVSFLWHLHQPDYTEPGNTHRSAALFLPWVRMHALKDYVWLPRLLSEYSSLRHTINVVPSLLAQLDAYAHGASDPVLELCTGPAAALSLEQRRSLWEWAATLQPATQVEPLPRLAELLQHHRPETLSDADIVDLQTLLHLAWSGPDLRRHSAVSRLMEQQRHFTENDRDQLLGLQRQYLTEVAVALMHLSDSSGSEISVSPYYHPILPLLCSTDVARESMPDAQLPQAPFSAREDAQWHVTAAMQDASVRFGTRPHGMWPSEGSLSMEVLAIMAEEGIGWTATDAAVLQHSLHDTGAEYAPTAPFHPYQVTTSQGTIRVLFRDRELSDAIGFEYAKWNPERAAEDFLQRLRQRRARIIEHEGEQALTSACVPVILDGENCWEFYPENGEPFLRALMTRLASADDIALITCDEAASATTRPLKHLVAGSWIHGTFSIWIGGPTTNLAWELLADVRRGLPEQWYSELYRLEASDWWWWYDERHRAPHQWLFDRMFRQRLAWLYQCSHRQPPVNLDHPLNETAMKKSQDMNNQPRVHTFPVGFSTGAMHEGDSLTKHLTLETDDNWQRITTVLQRPCQGDEEVIITIRDRHGRERRCGITADETLFQSPLHDEGCQHLSPDRSAVYVRTADHWVVEIQEQRSDGRVATTHVEIHL